MKFNKVQPEDEEYWQRYFADVDLSQLEGRIGLDAGCGKGRYSVFTAPHLSALVALDGSDAVAAAAANLASYPSVLVIRADLRRPPLAPESFGFISCLGVLHHLENPREGFDALVKLLAPGGILLIYVYSRPSRLGFRSIALQAASQLRRITTALPEPVLRVLSWPVALFLWLTVVSVGSVMLKQRARTATVLPLAAYYGKPFRSLWLDTFDRLGAPIEHRYLWDEIQSWYDDTALVVDASRDESGFFILAHRL
jgi:SAM-dependent methyltransferase